MRNWDGIVTLLNVMDKLRLYPTLKELHDEAMADLEKLAEEKPKPERSILNAPKAEPKPVFEPAPKIDSDAPRYPLRIRS